jgi:hypothetical protein
MKVLFILGTLLFSCTSAEEPDSSDLVYNYDFDKTDELLDTKPEKFDFQVFIYEMTADKKDSILNCEQFYLNNLSIWKSGSCWYSAPFQSEYISEHSLEKGKTETSFETFDPLVCEAGGHSAYNRYKFEKKNGQITMVTHYKAWYEKYDEEGEMINVTEPTWFIGETIKITYEDNRRTLKAYNEDNELLETLINEYNEAGQLIFQEWAYTNEKTFRFYYTYSTF